MTGATRLNPFPQDPDRKEIWDILVRRDIEAFLNQEWSLCSNDFYAEDFWGLDGCHSQHPDHWRIGFPDLDSYREVWVSQSREFQKIDLLGLTKEEFLYQITVLRDIEIQGSRAVAHKRFHGEGQKVGGGKIEVSWQTLYFFKKMDGHWKVTGVIGYLPNPM